MIGVWKRYSWLVYRFKVCGLLTESREGGGGSTLYVKGLVAHLKTQKNTLKTYLSDLATQKIPQ